MEWAGRTCWNTTLSYTALPYLLLWNLLKSLEAKEATGDSSKGLGAQAHSSMRRTQGLSMA